MRGSPTSGAPTSSSSGTWWASASGRSSSRLGFRCPLSSRDSVLFEIPVVAASAVRVTPRCVRSRLSRGPTSARTAGMAGDFSTRLTYRRSRKQQRTCRRQRVAMCRESQDGGCNDRQTYDVAIVGGGAAGLSAALVLGRARRRVVVIDSGAPRNAPAAHMHGLPVPRRDATGRPARSRTRRARPVTASSSSTTRCAGIDDGFSVELAGGQRVERTAGPPRDRCAR